MAGKLVTLLSLAIIGIVLPQYCLAVSANSGKNIHFFSEAFTVINLALLVTALISIKQFFFPGEQNRTVFQVFNLIFTVVFYVASLSFLITYREYYIGFETLSAIDCVKKIFLERDIATAKHWIIVFAAIINVAYIIKNGRDAGFEG